MKGKQYYFESEDSETCYTLDYFIDKSSPDENELTLIEAIPDTITSGFVWCSYYGDTVEHSLCNKKECKNYNSKSGRGVCSDRGKLYFHGNKVTIKLQELTNPLKPSDDGK